LLLALGIGAVSPDLEKQGFFAVVFVYREYSGKREQYWLKKDRFSAPSFDYAQD
jgi:hypothetical protein